MATAHGQMNEHQLEAVIDSFWRKETDVLVCTTIVETGLDVSNANTLIVDRADRMGNTALHQAAKLNASGQVLALLKAGANPAARNQQGASFQTFLFKLPADKLNAQARSEREAVLAWLKAHDIAVEAPAR